MHLLPLVRLLLLLVTLLLPQFALSLRQRLEPLRLRQEPLQLQPDLVSRLNGSHLPVPLTPPVPPAAETQSQAGARASAASTSATSNRTPVSSSASDSPKLIVSHHESSPRAAAPEHLKSTADNSIAAPVDPSPLVSARTAVDKTVARPLPVDDAIAVDPGAADSSSGDLLSLAWPSGRGEDAPLRSTALSAAGGSGWGIPDVGWGTIGGLLSTGHLGVGFSASGGARGSGLLGLQMQQLAPADGSATSSLLLPSSSDGHADDVVAKGLLLLLSQEALGCWPLTRWLQARPYLSNGHAHGPIIGEGNRRGVSGSLDRYCWKQQRTREACSGAGWFKWQVRVRLRLRCISSAACHPR